MITREKVVAGLKFAAKEAWDKLPVILSFIPATAVAGKVLTEVKKIADEAIKVGKNTEEINETLKSFVKESKADAELAKEIKEVLKENRDPKNPAFINCALFVVKQGEALTEEEQERIASVLLGELTLEDEELDKFVTLFVDDYFGGDVSACDNAYELEAEYIAFNFDDSHDHDYSEEDLELIRDELNKIVGREVFEDYDGYGTDDSVGDYWG